jgi:hypothetical protein
MPPSPLRGPFISVGLVSDGLAEFHHNPDPMGALYSKGVVREGLERGRTRRTGSVSAWCAPAMAGPISSTLNFSLHRPLENIPVGNGKSNMVMSDIRRHRLTHFAGRHQRGWKPSLDDFRAVVKPQVCRIAKSLGAVPLWRRRASSVTSLALKVCAAPRKRAS